MNQHLRSVSQPGRRHNRHSEPQQQIRHEGVAYIEDYRQKRNPNNVVEFPLRHEKNEPNYFLRRSLALVALAGTVYVVHGVGSWVGDRINTSRQHNSIDTVEEVMLLPIDERRVVTADSGPLVPWDFATEVHEGPDVTQTSKLLQPQAGEDGVFTSGEQAVLPNFLVNDPNYLERHPGTDS